MRGKRNPRLGTGGGTGRLRGMASSCHQFTTPSPSATINAFNISGVRGFVVDCAHGSTAVVYSNGPAFEIPESVAVAMALGRHHEEEGCACTRKLRERFGGAL